MERTKYSDGFSLVELITVVVVVAILAAVAIPSFNQIISGQRIRNASFELFATLMFARSEAVKRNGDVTITPLGGEWQNGWQITDPDGAVIRNHQALRKIVISNAPESLVFRRTGRLTATALPAFQFDVVPPNEDYVRCVSITLSGLPKTSKEACS